MNKYLIILFSIIFLSSGASALDYSYPAAPFGNWTSFESSTDCCIHDTSTYPDGISVNWTNSGTPWGMLSQTINITNLTTVSMQLTGSWSYASTSIIVNNTEICPGANACTYTFPIGVYNFSLKAYGVVWGGPKGHLTEYAISGYNVTDYLTNLHFVDNVSTDNTILFSWEITPHDGDPFVYDIYRDGVYISSTTNTSYLGEGLTTDTEYNYTVKISTLSDSISLISSTLKYGFYVSQLGTVFLNLSHIQYVNASYNYTVLVLNNNFVGNITNTYYRLFGLQNNTEYNIASYGVFNDGSHSEWNNYTVHTHAITGDYWVEVSDLPYPIVVVGVLPWENDQDWCGMGGDWAYWGWCYYGLKIENHPFSYYKFIYGGFYSYGGEYIWKFDIPDDYIGRPITIETYDILTNWNLYFGGEYRQYNIEDGEGNIYPNGTWCGLGYEWTGTCVYEFQINTSQIEFHSWTAYPFKVYFEMKVRYDTRRHHEATPTPTSTATEKPAVNVRTEFFSSLFLLLIALVGMFIYTWHNRR